MSRQIIVYGHGDKSESGFKTPQALVEYLEGGIFEDEDGRYRYSQTKAADVIVSPSTCSVCSKPYWPETF